MKTKLVIKNKTNWDTRQLRRVFLAVLRHSEKFDGPLRASTLKVNVTWAKKGYYSGCAYLNSGWMQIRLPNKKWVNEMIDGVLHCQVKQVAVEELDTFKAGYLFEHELAHCRGQSHKTMGVLNDWGHATPANYPYLEGMTVRRHASSAKPKPPAPERRHAAVLTKLAAWQSKKKRAETAIKKLARQRRYYEKKAAARTAN